MKFCLGMNISRNNQLKLPLVLGPWNAFDLLLLPVPCSSSIIHWFNFILITAVWFGVITVTPFVLNCKNYKSGRHGVLNFCSHDASADYLFELLGWKELDCQRYVQKAVMVYKSLNGLAPDYLCSKFVDRSSVSQPIHKETPRANLPFPFSYWASAMLGQCYGIVFQQSCGKLKPFRVFGCRSYFN